MDDKTDSYTTRSKQADQIKHLVASMMTRCGSIVTINDNSFLSCSIYLFLLQ